ncbi:monovalent cation:proton antiporter family protein [Cupriavidus respiraculi]|uniref:Glutathione-regulated potassium-efflux system protein KefC n=1 Tax=Cupriavidus respiraculi TaxID=195930 RepID=A0ABM8X577_9BURK|nr:monovalent cation:proton antiporter family protein [Cupriavidus respiraculi]MBY4946098.1 monovalent cation:proton antiporter-2 (CPA2) family protein [Cupriavidus respiraculi]CAG9175076.1 Glutathione-regulated potassium-efflux system protein KefC [Cupriavidus respiraculi]
MHSPLDLTLVLLTAGVLGVVAFRMLQLPPVLGYLAVGILIGPHALGMASDTAQTKYLAEFGVVFLMFSIGLEFSLAKLRGMKRLVFGLGGMQVALCIVAVLPASLALQWLFPLSWQASIALGGALAMSSTAIVSKMLSERVELETEHGRNILGVLLFQDLAVVPLLIVIPALSRDPGDLPMALSLAILKIAVALTLIFFVGKRLMSRWFHVVAARRSQELFMLNLLLVTLGMAALTERLGLSMALGAFLAGMLISETPYRHQVEEDIKPFRDVLLGLFFVTIGMLLNIRVVLDHLGLVLLLLVVPILFKFVLIAALARLFGSRQGVAIRTGLGLAQAGEFGFVLLAQIDGLNLVDPVLSQVILAAMLLSMLIAPFLIQYSESIALRFAANEWLMQSLNMTRIAAQSLQTEKHAIICGYGRSGQNLAHMLEREGINYVALDLDPDRVREAAAAGDTVVYGDAGRREALIAAGIHRAAAVIVTYANTPSAVRVLHHVHELEPSLPVIVRTVDDSELEILQRAGATEVVPEIIEGSLMLASHAMVLLGVPMRRVVRKVQEARDARYSLLRGYFHGRDDDDDMVERDSVRLHSVSLDAGATAVGRRLGALGLDRIGVEVTAVRRRGIRAFDPQPETVLEPNDIVVLRGTPEALEAAEARMTHG